MASRPSAASGAPAWCLACAAASARAARRAGSSVSPADRSRNAAAAARPPRALGPARALLEFGGDVLIGARRGLGPVPGPPVRINHRVGGLGQRAV